MSTLGLDRSQSLEDLICSPDHKLEISNTSLALKVVLHPLFQEGWDPNQFGMHKLVERATLWLKGIHGLQQSQPNEQVDLPGNVQDALQSFQGLQDSISNMEKNKQQHQSKMSIVTKAAEGKFQKLVRDIKQKQQVEQLDLETAQQQLKVNKQVIEDWATQYQQKLLEEMESLEKAHATLLEVFEKKVRDLVKLAHQEFSEADSSRVGGMDGFEKDLLKELEEELSITLSKSILDGVPLKPLDKEVEPLAPEGTVTGAYAKVSQAIGEALKGTSLEDSAKEAVFDAFKAAMDKPSKPTASPTPPSLPPTEVPKVTAPPAAVALRDELKRGDTTTVGNLGRGSTSDLEDADLASAAVQMPDGSIMYRSAKGKLETLEQRVKRLGHNRYMQFTRTFESSLAFYSTWLYWSFSLCNNCMHAFVLFFISAHPSLLIPLRPKYSSMHPGKGEGPKAQFLGSIGNLQTAVHFYLMITDCNSLQLYVFIYHV